MVGSKISPRISCVACGLENEQTALFCTRCTAPLAVVGLAELNDADRRRCFAALLQVLADVNRCEASSEHDDELWRAYLSAFWLRPETALILYAEAIAIRKARGKSPWLDLGCGDGIHAALYSGWRFDPTFDAFQSLNPTAADIYHHWNPADFTAKKVSNGSPIAHGIDIKNTAIERANALGIFSTAQQADATKLPLADRSVGTIFSNMLRDLGDPLPAALAECRRVLRDDGKLLISAMTPAYASNLYFAPAARQAEIAGDSQSARELIRLDRGRSVFCRRQLSVQDWQSLLSEHGLRVSAVHPIVGPAIIRFWDIGLRPFTVQLLRQRQTWKEAGVLTAIKPAAVDFLASMLEPLVRELTVGEPCMNLLVVEKS